MKSEIKRREGTKKRTFLFWFDVIVLHHHGIGHRGEHASIYTSQWISNDSLSDFSTFFFFLSYGSDWLLVFHIFLLSPFRRRARWLLTLAFLYYCSDNFVSPPQPTLKGSLDIFAPLAIYFSNKNENWIFFSLMPRRWIVPWRRRRQQLQFYPTYIYL